MNPKPPQPEPASSEPLAAVATEVEPRSKPSMLLRVAWQIAGVFLPLVCFAIGFPDQPTWQSGHISEYAKLLMSRGPSLPLYPLLLASAVSIALLSMNPTRWAKNGWIWLGMFGGVVLSIEYWLLFVSAFGDVTTVWQLLGQCTVGLFLSAIAWAVPWFIARLIAFGLSRPQSVIPTVCSVIILIVAPVVAFPYSLVALLLVSTPWAVAAYVSAAIWLVRNREGPLFHYTLAQLLIATTSLAVHFAAWRVAFQIMLAKYATLPLEAPNECFICSAAARGHRHFVRSDRRFLENGNVMLVNDQLRVLKAFELLIATISPTAHRALRLIYNRIGPRLAAALVHPLAADAAYLAIKPLEWFARLALRIALGKHVALIARLYRV